VSLPLNRYRKVAVDFCSDQGAMKEHSLSSVTEEQRGYGQKDQDLVLNEFSGNDTSHLPKLSRISLPGAQAGKGIGTAGRRLAAGSDPPPGGEGPIAVDSPAPAPPKASDGDSPKKGEY
jgi:hypothetical protein